jgi:hypothetical protein
MYSYDSLVSSIKPFFNNSFTRRFSVTPADFIYLNTASICRYSRLHPCPVDACRWRDSNHTKGVWFGQIPGCA